LKKRSKKLLPLKTLLRPGFVASSVPARKQTFFASRRAGSALFKKEVLAFTSLPLPFCWAAMPRAQCRVKGILHDDDQLD
jgi:hypothetical protein